MTDNTGSGIISLTDGVEKALGRVSVTHPVDAETIRGFVAQLAEQVEATWLDGVPEDLSPAAVKLARRVQALRDGEVYAIVLFKVDGGELVYNIKREGKLERAG